MSVRVYKTKEQYTISVEEFVAKDCATQSEAGLFYVLAHPRSRFGEVRFSDMRTSAGSLSILWGGPSIQIHTVDHSFIIYQITVWPLV